MITGPSSHSPHPHQNQIQTTLPPTQHYLAKKATSIFVSAAGAATITYPLDFVRSLKMGTATGAKQVSTTQLIKGVVNDYGYWGFAKQGVAPEISRVIFMRSLKWGLYPYLHKRLTGTTPENGNTRSRVTSSGITAFVECIGVGPLETAKIALQFDATKRYNNSMFKAIQSIYNAQGWTGLYAAYPSLLIRQTAWATTYFATFEIYKKKQEPLFAKISGGGSSSFILGIIKNFTAGFAAGATGTIPNTPWDVLRTNVTKRAVLTSSPKKQQFSLALAKESFDTTRVVFFEIIKNQGFRGLYKGWPIKAIHLGSSGALMAVFIGIFNKVWFE